MSYTPTTLNYPQLANTAIRRYKAAHAPNSTKNFILGDEWLNTAASVSGEWWKLSNLATGGLIWVRLGGGSGQVNDLQGDTGGPVAPDASNIIYTLGTANQITVTGNPGTNTLTWSLTNGIAAAKFDVQANTAPGTDPVLPTSAGVVTVNGAVVAAHSVPLETRSRAANAYNLEAQYASAIAATDGTKVGMAAFNSSQFSVDASGFVALAGGGEAIDSIAVQTGTSPIVPTAAGLVTINGATVAAGTNPVRTDGTGANTMAVEVQISQAIAATDATKIGLASFDSALFTVDANGFVSMSGAVNYISLSPFIVGTDVHSGYATIALGIAAAISAGATDSTPMNVYIKPKADGSVYTENLGLVPGVNLVAFGRSVTVVGKATMTAAGTCNIQGLTLQTNSDFLLVVSGIAASIVRMENCVLNCTNNTGISFTSSSASSSIIIKNCNGDTGTTGIKLWDSSSAGGITVLTSNFTNTGATLAITSNSAGTVAIFESFLAHGLSCTGGNLTINNTTNYSGFFSVTSLDVSGAGIYQGFNSVFGGGTSAAVTIGATATLTLTNCVVDSTNTNAISGAGALHFANLSFTSTSSTISSTTQAPQVSSNDALKIVTPAAYPYTTIPQDAVILVDTSAARTIIPLASPTTGQKHVIKDSVGSASANNITITPSGKNIDGAASRTIASNYGSVTIVYNGSEWSII